MYQKSLRPNGVTKVETLASKGFQVLNPLIHNNSNDYIDKILNKICNYHNEIYEINASLDLYVFVYTQASSKKPIQIWVRDLADLMIAIEREDEEPYLSLEMHHTLFYPFSYNGGEDNTELCGLNQPLLEEALKNWEQNFGIEIDVQGLPGIYKYGYLPEDQW